MSTPLAVIARKISRSDVAIQSDNLFVLRIVPYLRYDIDAFNWRLPRYACNDDVGMVPRLREDHKVRAGDNKAE